MDIPISYSPGFVSNPDVAFDRLWRELNWEEREGAPRREYYCNTFQVPYTYGSGAGVRTYHPQPWHPVIQSIREDLEKVTGTTFDVCFLNGYRDGRDQLGWHSDNSPEMDDDRPIAIVSLGAEREIWFRPMVNEGGHLMVELVPPAPVSKLSLANGSLCLMLPGMQDTHQHRIPKSSLNICGPRISLTFRGYVSSGKESA